MSDDFLLPEEKKHMDLLLNNPSVCFTTLTHLNESIFVPIIDISGYTCLPVHLKEYNLLTNNEIEKQPKPTKNQQDIKVPSRNLRAKTIRIGKIRWPPPLNSDEIDAFKQQKQMRIQEEIHSNEHLDDSSFVDITPPNSKSNPQQQLRTTSQNTSDFSLTFADSPQSILPTILDEEEEEEEDIYDRLTYQITIPPTPEHFSIKNTKRRRHLSPYHTNKKRLHRRRPPTYIKELKAYLAHRESSVTEITKISDVKKFSNVLVWLSNQTTSPSLLETSTVTSLKKLDHSSSITTDSVIARTQSDSDPIPPFTDETNTSKSSSRQSLTYLTYDNITWKLKIRKEVFSPTELFDQPFLIELLYLQIIRDVFSSICIRINEGERINMKIFLSSHGVSSIADMNSINTISIKKTIIEQARQWSLYFCRLFPISSPSKSQSNEVYMLGISHSGIRLIKRNRDVLQVLETFSFDMIQHISSIENGLIIDLCSSKKRITIHSHRIEKIHQMIGKFLKEFNFEKKLTSSSSQISLMSCSPTFSEGEIHTTKSIGYSMMEFALQHFQIPNKRRSKKSWKTLEWTWQDYTELLKWSKNPIQTPLLRNSANDLSRTARQCFLAIMRFMGDYSMARNQTDLDCLFYLIKNMHKHRILIDEVLCQIIKQLTDNKSIKTDSIQDGWKLLTILLNYFIPSEYLQPYFIKYLHDNQNERLVQLCLNHYEQTLKYGGRKHNPNKEEIDLLTIDGQNEGKHQIFLLPGGFPLTLLTTPSMIIADCLNLLCDQIKISNPLENDEYSIFILSTSEHSSRLLNPTEYLFDILIESNLINFHFIIKRMIWFNIPFLLDNQSEIFIDFMYHQLIPELLEGIMIILNNNHLSEEFMEEISLMAALQYRASLKIGLPSMREVKYLLPATVLKLKSVHPQDWTAAVHDKLYSSVNSMSIIEAKIKFLNLIQTWPLFGKTFFTVESINDPSIRSPCLISIYKSGILFLDLDTREIMLTISYNDIVSIHRHQTMVDIKYGNLNQPHILQCQINKAQDLVALSERYLRFIGRISVI